MQVKHENYNSIKKLFLKKEETVRFGPSVARQDNSLTPSSQGLPFSQGQVVRQRRHLRVRLKTSEVDPGASWDLGQRGWVCGTWVMTPKFMTQLCHKLAVASLPFYRIMVREPLPLPYTLQWTNMFKKLRIALRVPMVLAVIFIQRPRGRLFLELWWPLSISVPNWRSNEIMGKCFTQGHLTT